MKNIIRILLFLIVSPIIIYIIVSVGNTNKLNLKRYSQQKSEWCWVASTQMVVNYLKNYSNIIYSQCDIVSANTTDINCCNDTTCNSYGNNCNFSMQHQDYANMLEKINYKSDSTWGFSNFDWTKIQSNLDNKSPFIITNLEQRNTTSNRSYGGIWINHAVVGYAYVENWSNKWLIVQDPWDICQGCTYALDFETLRTGGLNIIINNNEINENGDETFPPIIFHNFVENKIISPQESNYSAPLLSVSHSIKRKISDIFLKEQSKNEFKSSNYYSKILKSFTSNASKSILNDFGLNQSFNLDNAQFSNKIKNKVINIQNLQDNISYRTDDYCAITPNLIINVIIDNRNILQYILVQINGTDFYRIVGISDCPWLSITDRVASNRPTNIDALNLKIPKTELSHLYLPNSGVGFYEIKDNNEKYYLSQNLYKDVIENKFYSQKEFTELMKKLYGFNKEIYSTKAPYLTPTATQRPSQRPQEQN